MIPIIISSLAAVMFLLVVLITAIVLIVNMIRKKQLVKRDLSILIITTLVFFSLVGIDMYLISSRLAYSKEKTKQVALDAAENTGEGLVVTYDAIKKTWDKRSVEKLKNIDITVSESSEVIKGDNKSYEIKVIFNNKNSTAESMSIDEMVSLNYLMGCDKDDIVHAIKGKEYETKHLPMGKSEATFFIDVKKDVELKYLRLVDRKFAIK